jgi:hypothetical protein
LHSGLGFLVSGFHLHLHHDEDFPSFNRTLVAIEADAQIGGFV